MSDKKKVETEFVDGFYPNYKRKCENCGETPVVAAMKNGKRTYSGTMCGPCTWGESEMIDPDKWNK